MKVTPVLDTVAILATLVLVGHGISGCSESSAPSAPSGDTGAPIGVTLTLTTAGVSSDAPRIAIGERVRFTNNDNVPHQIFSTPHGPHTDCLATNAVGMLQPGQSRETNAYSERRGCGFHDHLDPDNVNFRGQVIAGFSEDDPNPADPAY
jgi:plastocyanin